VHLLQASLKAIPVVEEKGFPAEVVSSHLKSGQPEFDPPCLALLAKATSKMS